MSLEAFLIVIFYSYFSFSLKGSGDLILVFGSHDLLPHFFLEFEDIFPNEDKLFLEITKPVSSPKHRDVAPVISSCTSTNLEPNFDSIGLDLSTIKSEGMFPNIQTFYGSIYVKSSEFVCEYIFLFTLKIKPK